MAFVDQPPDGIPGPAKAAPSACAFWREAERGLFHASAGVVYGPLAGFRPDPGQMLPVVPGARGSEFVAALERLSTANSAMNSSYHERASRFS